jgi:hypothetical protein
MTSLQETGELFVNAIVVFALVASSVVTVVAVQCLPVVIIKIN